VHVNVGVTKPAGVLWVRGSSFQDYVANFVTGPGVISLLMFLLFAVMPAVTAKVAPGRGDPTLVPLCYVSPRQ